MHGRHFEKRRKVSLSEAKIEFSVRFKFISHSFPCVDSGFYFNSNNTAIGQSITKICALWRIPGRNECWPLATITKAVVVKDLTDLLLDLTGLLFRADSLGASVD
jgi:hypothetical protein